MDNKSEDPKYLYMLPISNSFMIDELQKEQRKKTEMEEMIKFTKWIESLSGEPNYESNGRI